MTRAVARPRGRPTTQESAELEDLLLDAALDEFVAHGYGGASLSRIVRQAKISKTTLYSRFPSKEALFRALMERHVDEAAAARALRPLPGQPDLATGLKSFANRMLERSLEGRLLKVNRLIFSEAHRFPELGVAAAENTERGIARVTDFLAECRTDGAHPVRHPRRVAEVFIHTIRGWYINQVMTGGSASKEQREGWVEQAVDTLTASPCDW